VSIAGATRHRAQGVWRGVLQPLVALLAGILGRLHLWVVVMILLYLGSGITIVGPDEVALVERFGRIAGRGTAAATHGPGMLFALPRPFDQVLRVNVKRVYEAEVATLVPPTSDVNP